MTGRVPDACDGINQHEDQSRSSIGAMAVRRVADTRAVRGGTTVKAKAVGGPARAVPAAKSQASAQLAKLSAKQVIAEIARRQDVAIGNAYAMGLCLKELSRPERYRDELGFKSFEELLGAHEHLPTRMTAHKYFTVIEIFSEVEVRR